MTAVAAPAVDLAANDEAPAPSPPRAAGRDRSALPTATRLALGLLVLEKYDPEVSIEGGAVLVVIEADVDATERALLSAYGWAAAARGEVSAWRFAP